MKHTQHEDWAAYKNAFIERFTLDDSYVICGVGGGFQTLIELFPEINISYCLDAKAEEKGRLRWEVYPYQRLKTQNVKTQKFIITPGGDYYAEIKNCLLSYGIPEDNICGLKEIVIFWGERYHKKVYTAQCAVVLLTQCNLRCKGCIQLTPYLKQFHYRDLDSVKAELDQFFRISDFTVELALTGGETFLYKEFGEVCAYIKDNFSDRYYKLIVYTNGTVLPKEEAIMELGKLERVHVLISDYTCSIDKSNNLLIEYLNKYNIKYTLNNSFGQSAEYMWFDLGNPAEQKSRDVSAIKNRFKNCTLTCPSLFGGRIYYCSPYWSAILGKTTALEGPEVYLDLDQLERLAPEQRSDEIGKFMLGFFDQGYLEFCKFCNGFGKDVNNQFVKAGEQC